MASRASADSSQASATARAKNVRSPRPTRSTSGAVTDQLEKMASKNASTRSTANSTLSPTTSAAACVPTATSAHIPSGRKIQRILLTLSVTRSSTGGSYGPSFVSARVSERDISVLALRDFLPLVLQHRQCAAELRAGVLGEDDFVDVTELGRLVRVGERVAVRLHQLFARRALFQLAAEDDADRAVRAHHGDLGGRPGEVHIGADVLRRHHVVRAAVRLARDHGQLRHRRFREGIEQLRSVRDDAAPLLRGAGPKTWDVDEGEQRYVERVAGAHEPRAFPRGVDVEHAGEDGRLVGDDADAAAAEPREPADDVAREVLLDLEEVPVVDDRADDFLDVVRLVRVFRDEGLQNVVAAIERVLRGDDRRLVQVVGGQIAQEL